MRVTITDQTGALIDQGKVLASSLGYGLTIVSEMGRPLPGRGLEDIRDYGPADQTGLTYVYEHRSAA